MVHTFKFVGTVKDGPGWKVFFDSACGAVFEYPEGDTVRTTVEDSKARSESNEITCSQSFTHRGLDYTVAAKLNLMDKSKFEASLKLSGYPDLSEATVYSDVGTLYRIQSRALLLHISPRNNVHLQRFKCGIPRHHSPG
jgi:hypothetical protein